jgi:hypothetical protein
MGTLPKLSSPSEAIAREHAHEMFVSQGWSRRVELIPGNRRASLRHENDAKARARISPLMHALKLPPLPIHRSRDVLHTTICSPYCACLHIGTSSFSFGLVGKYVRLLLEIHVCLHVDIDHSWLMDAGSNCSQEIMKHIEDKVISCSIIP